MSSNFAAWPETARPIAYWVEALSKSEDHDALGAEIVGELFEDWQSDGTVTWYEGWATYDAENQPARGVVVFGQWVESFDTHHKLESALEALGAEVCFNDTVTSCDACAKLVELDARSQWFFVESEGATVCRKCIDVGTLEAELRDATRMDCFDTDWSAFGYWQVIDTSDHAMKWAKQAADYKYRVMYPNGAPVGLVEWEPLEFASGMREGNTGDPSKVLALLATLNFETNVIFQRGSTDMFETKWTVWVRPDICEMCVSQMSGDMLPMGRVFAFGNDAEDFLVLDAEAKVEIAALLRDPRVEGVDGGKMMKAFLQSASVAMKAQTDE